MAEVRSLQVARAWLWLSRAPEEDDVAREARALLAEAEADPNRSAARHARHIQALRERLSDSTLGPRR